MKKVMHCWVYVLIAFCLEWYFVKLIYWKYWSSADFSIKWINWSFYSYFILQRDYTVMLSQHNLAWLKFEGQGLFAAVFHLAKLDWHSEPLLFTDKFSKFHSRCGRFWIATKAKTFSMYYLRFMLSIPLTEVLQT